MFVSNHCPFVQHVAPTLATLGARWQEQGVAVVAVGSNDTSSHPEDGPDAIAAEVEARGYPFPYLHDADQQVAAAFHAACTPDFFLYDADRRLAYRGQLDDSRPGNGVPVTGEDLDGAVQALLAGRAVPEPQHPSMGCNIRWRPGNEPA